MSWLSKEQLSALTLAEKHINHEPMSQFYKEQSAMSLIPRLTSIIDILLTALEHIEDDAAVHDYIEYFIKDGKLQ